jgi:hypothetical protein
VVDPGGIQDALGADGGLRHRNGQSRTPVAERVSWGREPDLETSDQGLSAALKGEKATLAEIAQRLGRKALEELAAVAKPDTLLVWYRNKAILGMVSESPGRNESKPTGGLGKKIRSGGRAPCCGAKAAWHGAG